MTLAQEIARALPGVCFGGAQVTADYLLRAAYEQRIYLASDADQNDVVTGQTSFANTTPTFQLDVPGGRVAMPLYLDLSQTGSVAGGAIDVIIEVDSVLRYASGGTKEKAVNSAGRESSCVLRSGATAVAGYGMNLLRATIGQDVSPAEGAVQGPWWRPAVPIPLRGPASWNIFTYAGTTGPTWFWSAGWIEWTAAEYDALARQR